ncbi:hypothetical protein D3C80_1746580 [compost metagenome]
MSNLLRGFAFGTNKEIIIVSKWLRFFSISAIELLFPVSIENSGDERVEDNALKKVLSVFL